MVLALELTDAEVLSVRQTPGLNNGRNFVDRVNKKVTNFVRFPNISGKQQHFNATNGKLMYCFRRESFFWYKINLKTVPNRLLFSLCIQEISLRRHILSTKTLYILHLCKQSTEYISTRASQRAGLALFSVLNSELPKKSCMPKYKKNQPTDPIAVRRSFQPLKTITACIITWARK